MIINDDDTITIVDSSVWDESILSNCSPTYSIAVPATEIEIHQSNGETLKVAATIRQQTYEIEALTDIIKEMVKTKNFDVELDIEKRVEQKKFLKRLGED